MNNSESQLLARCRNGEPSAWDELFELHYAAAGRFVFQISSEFKAEDVEEICQETFLTVIRSIDTFQGNSRFQTWLFRVAANKAHDYLEKQRAAKRGGGQRPISLQADDSDGMPIDPPAQQPGPDGALIRAEDCERVAHALSVLGNPCQEIIELRYFGDLSYEEIASALELNVKTVSSRLSKCLDKLQALARKVLSEPIAPERKAGLSV